MLEDIALVRDLQRFPGLVKPACWTEDSEVDLPRMRKLMDAQRNGRDSVSCAFDMCKTASVLIPLPKLGVARSDIRATVFC